MGCVKTAISLPEALLKQVDTLAKKRGVSRSEFVRHCLEREVSDEIPERVLSKARALYAAIEEDDLAMAEDFLSVAAETLPPYEGGDET